MKATKLRGMPVISIDDAKRLGEVRDVLVDTENQRVAALDLKGPSGHAGSTVPVDDIHSIGKDAITLRDTPRESRSDREPSGEPVRPEDSGDLRPDEPRDRERQFDDFDRDNFVPLGKLIGAKAVSTGGDSLGTVEDVEIDPSNFHIMSYELGSGELSKITGNVKRLEVNKGVRFANNILMVPEGGQVTEEHNSRSPFSRHDDRDRTDVDRDRSDVERRDEERRRDRAA